MRSVHVSCAMFASRHASSQAAHAAGLAASAVQERAFTTRVVGGHVS